MVYEPWSDPLTYGARGVFSVDERERILHFQ